MASRLDKHIGEIVEGRKRGLSFSAIAAALGERHGLEIGKRGLAGWYRRRQRRLREREEEVEVFASERSASSLPVERSVSFPRPEDSHDDWTAPAESGKMVLKVMRNSQRS